MSSSRHIASTAALLLLTLTLRSQEPTAPEAPPPPPSSDNVLSVRVRVVAVTALVRDDKGQLINNLNKEEFTLLEDKKPQTIRYFNRDNDLPLMIGLMVDTSGSETPFFAEEGRASNIFLHSMLTHPEDKAFIIRFDTNVFQLRKVTSDLPGLEHALTLLQVPHDPRPAPAPPPGTTPTAGTHGAPHPAPHTGGGTLLWDAVCAAAQQVAGKQPGRRALVVMTDGEDNGSTASLDQAVELSQQADTAVYSIMYSSRPPDDPFNVRPHFGLNPTEGLEHLSQTTGGRFFRVAPGYPIDKIYAQIEQDLRTQYRLGYTPPPSDPNHYHSLEIRTQDKHLKVQSRTGYYTPQ